MGTGSERAPSSVVMGMRVEAARSVSLRCCNKRPWIQWLNTARVCHLTSLEAGILTLVSLGWDQGLGRAGFLLEAPGVNLLLSISSF